MKKTVTITAFLLISFCLSHALAQQPSKPPSDTDSQEESAVFSPPELLEYVEAEYPPEAFAQGLEAKVSVLIDVDENGIVSNVEVVEPAGHGFDEAASDAIYQFLFSPALNGDQPVPSRVTYRYTFFLTQQEQPTDEPSSDTDSEPEVIEYSKLTGRITDMQDKPLAGASLLVISLGVDLEDMDDEAGTNTEPQSAPETDKQGVFQLELEDGPYQIDIVMAGYKVLSVEEKLEPGELREVIYRLEMEDSLYETVVRGRRPPREVTRREITRREITRIPGTGGDALRAVQNLPGMARAPGISGALIVRGSSPGDSQYYFDQMPVPLLYHFGGLTSVINSDLLERIDFYPGNYGVRYGNATGGIIDVYPRAPATDRFHGYVDADLWDISALAETPIGEKWSVAASVRRSYIDVIINAAVPDNGGFAFTVAPRYYDYQLILDYHPCPRSNLRLFLFGSDDKMVFVTGDSVSGNPGMSGDMQFSIYFHQAQARWEYRLSKHLSNSLNIGTGIQTSDSSFGDFIFKVKAFSLFARDELEAKLSPHLVLRGGIDTKYWVGNYKLRVPDFMPTEGEPMNPISTNDEMIEMSGKDYAFQPAWYAELELRPLPNLRLINGVRVDYFSMLEDKLTVDPRFVGRYEVVPGTTIKGGVGMFHQVPTNAELVEPFGNAQLGPINAIHYSLGVEQKLFQYIEIGLEGFFKDISSLVVSTDDLIEQDGSMVSERYNNEGTGKVYGMEFLLKHLPSEHFFGWISYTLMASKRVDHPGEQERRFDYDQTHILTIVASAILGRGWEAGIRYRLTSGNPSTPIIGSIFEADSDIYFPVYGQTNTSRLPMFHQLDFRVDKRWELKYLKLSVYVDVQNVYNQKNAEGHEYSYDFSQKQYFYGLPLLPSFGFKVEY